MSYHDDPARGRRNVWILIIMIAVIVAGLFAAGVPQKFLSNEASAANAATEG